MQAMIRFMLWPIAAIALVGCGAEGKGGDTSRKAVSGAVTLDDQPLDKGTVQFIPKDPNLGSPVTATIADGKYAFEKDQGPLPGSYSVRISALEGEEAPVSAIEALENAERPTKKPAPKERVAAKYNKKTELTAEVRPDGQTTQDFAVKSK